MYAKVLLVVVYAVLVKGQYYDICEQLTLPSEPNEYPIGTKCTQTITPPDGQLLEIELNGSTERQGCRFNALTIKIGTRRFTGKTFCGRKNAMTFLTQETVEFMFLSTALYNSTGFEIYWRIFGRNSGKPVTVVTTTTLPKTTMSPTTVKTTTKKLTPQTQPTTVELVTVDIPTICLNAHNKYRRLHGVPDLVLSDELTEGAKEWATYISNNPPRHTSDKTVGENLAMGTSLSSTRADVEKAVELWYNEINLYDFNNPQWSSATGHFTQLVWKSTSRLGCAIAYDSNGYAYTVARYKEKGNWVMDGFFEANVPKPLI